jgi:hypothetical protein
MSFFKKIFGTHENQLINRQNIFPKKRRMKKITKTTPYLIERLRQ